MEPPVPSPEMVTASRRHLTERYAAGVDRLLWDTEKRFMPDVDAVRSVIAGAVCARAEALDVGAALVLLQAARLGIDRLEHQVFEAAGAIGMPDEAIAAVLELPDAAAVGRRRRWLRRRWSLPVAEAGQPRGPADGPEVTGRAGRRARLR